MKQRIFTLRQIIEEGTEFLKTAGIEEAALDAWYLLEYTTGISRASYYGEPDRIVDERQARQYMEYIGTRGKRIPLQHITGEQEFMGYPFYVDAHVLIPRQDTETLVEEAVGIILQTAVLEESAGGDEEGAQICGSPEYGKVRVLDMCTGSGCILLSILKLCPQAEGEGCDISKDALAVARRNAGRLKVDARWICSDLFENWGPRRYDVIVSNPPYIRTEDIEGLKEEVRVHDPRIALDGGADGLCFYRRIIEGSVSHIEDGGYLLFEIGCDQGKDVAELMESRGYQDVVIKKDLPGLDRVVMGRYNKDK
ncbi:MAG: peptide chain release factor N(5)-glutamine methyltransferase [Lachnospiraceae bacterium]